MLGREGVSGLLVTNRWIEAGRHWMLGLGSCREAAGQGYRAGWDMCQIVHHREHGAIERHRREVAML